MKLGIIGFGYTGQQHARAAMGIPRVSLGAVADTDPQGGSQVAVPFYADYHQVLDDPTIDAVSICLPHFLHEKVGTEALRAKKHVLMEKPLAMTVESGEQLCQLARSQSCILMVEMTHRFMPPVMQARQRVLAGDVGEVMAVTDVLVEGLGVFGSLPDWMFSKSLAGGGVGLTSGIHLLDHVAWITGQSLSLESASLRCSPTLGDIENVASFSLHLSQGAPVQVLLCWRPGNGDLAGELSVFGSKGTLTVQVWGGWKLTNERGLQEKICFDERLTVAQRACEGMKLALTEFVEAVHEQRDPVPRAQETLVSQRLIEQAYRYAGNRNSSR